jgi:hypothetical protein
MTQVKSSSSSVLSRRGKRQSASYRHSNGNVTGNGATLISSDGFCKQDENGATVQSNNGLVPLSVLFRTVGVIVEEIERAQRVRSPSSASATGTSTEKGYKSEASTIRGNNILLENIPVTGPSEKQPKGQSPKSNEGNLDQYPNTNTRPAMAIANTSSPVINHSSLIAQGTFAITNIDGNNSDSDNQVVVLKEAAPSRKIRPSDASGGGEGQDANNSMPSAALLNMSSALPQFHLPLIDYDADNEDNDTENSSANGGDDNERTGTGASQQGADLTKYSKPQLETKLAPIAATLAILDVKSILQLQECDNIAEAVSAGHGSLVKPIHTMVQPPVVAPFRYQFNAANHFIPVRYLHVYELPTHYSAGVFVFPPNAKIPLHDHPGMCVLSRILYGTLSVHSYDWIEGPEGKAQTTFDEKKTKATYKSDDEDSNDDDDDDMSVDSDPMEKLIQSRVLALGAANSLSNSWLGKATQEFSKWSTRALRASASGLIRGNSATAMDTDGDESSENEETERQHGPRSTSGGKSKKRRRPKRQKAKVVRRLARRRSVRTVSAPMVTTLFPFEGNVHEFVAGPHGAAVLDVLLPPYDEDHDRDCTFYIPEIDTVHEVPVGSTNDRGATNTDNSSETRVWLRQVPQPDDFQCVSGSYGNLGITDDS